MNLLDRILPPPVKKNEAFRPVSAEELAGMDGALLSFWRERCFRGNARKFRIMMDGAEIERIANEETRELICPPGIHQFHIQLDGMKSPAVNVKTEQGERYCFHIRCTMEEGMYLARIDLPEIQEDK